MASSSLPQLFRDLTICMARNRRLILRLDSHVRKSVCCDLSGGPQQSVPLELPSKIPLNPGLQRKIAPTPWLSPNDKSLSIRLLEIRRLSQFSIDAHCGLATGRFSDTLHWSSFGQELWSTLLCLLLVDKCLSHVCSRPQREGGRQYCFQTGLLSKIGCQI